MNRHLVEKTVASGLIYLNSHASDFKVPELRVYLDRFVRGSNGYSAERRVELLKLLWDAIGSEFGSRAALMKSAKKEFVAADCRLRWP